MSNSPHVAPTPERVRIALAMHAAAYAAVTTVLAITDLKTGGDTWFQWPLLGWGAGLVWHAFIVWRHVGLLASQADRRTR